MASLVWLITGASRGLGLMLAKEVLAAGHKVIATSRRPDSTPEHVAETQKTANGRWMQLDMNADNLEQQVERCIEVFGRIDVLVNNAGYAEGGPLEDTPLSSIRGMFETNFFGAVRTMKALIPHMRERKSGAIINITSSEGIAAAPGISCYAATKFALEGISEGLQAEMAAFGVRVLIVELGGMRTDFLDPSRGTVPRISEPYKGTAAEQVLNYVQGTHGQQMLDPVRAAQRIVEAITREGEGWPEDRTSQLRLPLGKEVAQRIGAKARSLQESVQSLEKVALTVDFND